MPIPGPINCDRGVVIEEYVSPQDKTWLEWKKDQSPRKERGTRQIVSQLSLTGEVYMHVSFRFPEAQVRCSQ